MAKKSKLVAALDAHKGRDYNLEKQKKLQKQADKRKKSRPQPQQLEAENEREDGARINGVLKGSGSESEGWESEESEKAGPIAIDTSRIDDSDSESEHDAIDEASVPPPTSNGKDPILGDGSASDQEDEDIPLSDIDSLPSEEKADILPHQRLTINNTVALLRAHKSISAPFPLPFSEHQTLVSAAPIAIADVNDDLNRELAFYKQCLDSAKEARVLLKKEGVPFSRPNDYFAEMVKSDEHMGKIKQKMTDEAANKKAAADARKQRDLKKFGKQVQVAKLQERDKAKREMLGKIEVLKRKRKSADTGATNEEDLFDVALEDASKDDRAARDGRRAPPNKRQKRNEKFGFGGKKRFAKSGDAVSTGDLKAFSTKKMKGKPQRLGKSRRAKI